MKRNQILVTIASLLLFVWCTWDFIEMVQQQHTRFVEEDIAAAIDELQKGPPGFERAERFIQKLRTVDTHYAPVEVKQALNDYADIIEQALAAMKRGDKAAPQDQAIAQKKQALIDAIKRGKASKTFP